MKSLIQKMRNILKFGKILIVLSALGMLCASLGFAQQGILSGNKMTLSNSTNAVTITSPAAPTSYTLTLPVTTPNSPLYIYNDGTGALALGVAAGAASTGTALYNTAAAQTISGSTNQLFSVGYSAGTTGNAVGAMIGVVANGPTGTTLTGLTVTARNIQTGAPLNGINIATLPNELAVSDTVVNAGSGTQIGLQVNVSGGGNNYAAITTSGLVGIGTSAPTDSLEVSGNIRISGINGLKIIEGTNAAMGTATLNGTTAVAVSTTAVTATSRIFLTTYGNPNTAPIGAPYVSARTAGTSFSIKSSVAADVNKVAWIIIEP
jgi:hypothetical protein